MAHRTSCLRFGPFKLDPRTGELHGNGVHVVLSEQPLRLLLALLDRPGQLITRDELRQLLWPEDTFVDFDHGLNAAVRRVRDALGDFADRPRYVETLPRRGYRFVGEIEAGPPAGEPEDSADTRLATTESAPVASAPAVRQKWGRGSTAFLALGILIVIIAASWFAGFTRRVDQPATRARELTRQTFGQGLQTDVTWSPDGQRIAFASNQGGNFDIWVQSLAGGEAARITSSPGADTQPAWSPAGDDIVFRSERDGGGLFVVSAAGGAARQVTTFGANPTWKTDGSEVLFRAGLGTIEHLYAVSARGGDKPREILSDFLRGGFWYGMAPAPHPDGRLTFVGVHRIHDFGVFTVGQDGKNPVVGRPSDTLLQTLGWRDPHNVRLQWNRAGTALYVEVASNDIVNLWKVRVAPGTLEWLSAERLTTGPGNATVASLSPDDEHLAFTSQHEEIRGWVFPFDSVAGRLTGGGRPVTPENAAIAHLRLSADGQSLLYDIHRAGTKTVAVMSTDVDTGKTNELAANARGPVGSRNGPRVCYVLTRSASAPTDNPSEGNLEYVLAVRDADGSERLVGRWSGFLWLGATDWTRDGQSILGSYWDLKDIGPVFLAVWPAPPAVASQPQDIVLRSSNHRFWQARFSPDDRWISFVAEATNEPGRLSVGVIAASGAARGKWTRIAADHDWADKPRWSPDGKTLYFLSKKPAGRFNVWAVQMDPVHGRQVGEPRQITHFEGTGVTIHPDTGNSEMDVAGRSLAVTTRDVTGSIWMLSGVQH